MTEQLLGELVQCARAAYAAEQWDAALQDYITALELASRNGSPNPEILRCIGLVHCRRGDFHHAEAALLQAQLWAEELGNGQVAVRVSDSMGSMNLLRGDYAAALRDYHTALAMYQKLGDDDGITAVLNSIAAVYLADNQIGEAESCFGLALALAEYRLDEQMIGTIHANLAQLHVQCGRYEEARVCCDDALTAVAQVGKRPARTRGGRRRTPRVLLATKQGTIAFR